MVEAKTQRVFLLANTVALAVFSVAGWGSAWLLLVSRLRNIAEHACIVENGIDPLRHNRTTHASLLAHVLITPTVPATTANTVCSRKSHAVTCLKRIACPQPAV